MAKKPVVIVVDDEADALEMYVRTLSSAYEVTTFNDPNAALVAAKAGAPELLIVDHKMPGLTGVQFVRKLREANVECATLMVTGFPEMTEVVDAQKSKLFFQVCPKPWKPEDLLAFAGMAVTAFRVQKSAQRLGRLDAREPPETGSDGTD